MMRSISTSALALTLALCLAGAARAQPMPEDRAAGPGAGWRHPSPEMRARHEAHEQQRLADLRIVLRLRPDQEGALATLLKAHAPPPPHEPAGPPLAEPMTTPQRLDQMAKRQAERMADAQRRVEALRTFYAALAPDQRQVFDALMRLRGPHGLGGHMGPGPGGPQGPESHIPPHP